MDYNTQIFLEALWSATLIPFSSEATLAAMAAFGGYDLLIPAICAIIGGTLGLLINLMIGRFLLSFHRKGMLHVSDYWYNKISILFNKYGVFLLLFAWISLFKLLVVLAGFLNAPTRFVLPLLLLGQIYHYGNYLL